MLYFGHGKTPFLRQSTCYYTAVEANSYSCDQILLSLSVIFAVLLVVLAVFLLCALVSVCRLYHTLQTYNYKLHFRNEPGTGNNRISYAILLCYTLKQLVLFALPL